MGDDSYIFIWFKVIPKSARNNYRLRDRVSLKQREEMVSDGENCLLPGMVVKAVKMERPEGETGLGKTQVGLIRKQLQTNQMEMK